MINHEGNSGAMEKEAAKEMFTRSIEKHNLRYTVYVGDRDSGLFGAVKDAVCAKYGDSYPIEKEDCIGHIQKRMGAALRSYKNNCRGKFLPYGKGVGGAGRLTDAAADLIQTYYGYAIRNNKGDIKKISTAIWAIFYHMILGPAGESLDKQHSFCPKSSDSWWKYQKDRKRRTELKPIFVRLSSNELLHGCQKGLTQNQNESINSVVWSRCPKRVFCGKRQFGISVCDAVSLWNDGARGRKSLYKMLNVDVGYNMMYGLVRQENIRLTQARRQALRQLRKTKCKNLRKDNDIYFWCF